jgi:hypothetical protein
MMAHPLKLGKLEETGSLGVQQNALTSSFSSLIIEQCGAIFLIADFTDC